MPLSLYPETAAGRDRWVLGLRGPKRTLDPWRAYAALWEEEPDASGALIPSAVVFLTNRECPFRCLMCDLWVQTLDASVPPGAIAVQIHAALGSLAPARQIKLYNAGSFFDPRAIPPDEDETIAGAVRTFDRVIVESHPAFLRGAGGRRCLAFRDRVEGRLEVAVGLETAHPGVLARLNKRMTVDGFRRAADFLSANAIDLRVFILLKPPFIGDDRAAVEWACRSLDVAVTAGATACTIIPTRGGNGALEALGPEFALPRLASLEAAVEYGLSLRACRVFADLWDVQRFFDCDCSAARAARLETMNRTQRPPAPVVCACGVN